MDTAAFGRGGAGLGGDRTSHERLDVAQPSSPSIRDQNTSRRDRKYPETVAVAQQKGRKDEEVRTWTIKKRVRHIGIAGMWTVS